ncbi:MAG: pseudaminic acid biosynthesis-associated methylase, partial [Candidatus Magasanikbacteria bacterium]|nr:pseudaminic acid biosynthesis-associated methylase [Candidatus Magasanikbacteria bacterium]
TGEVYLSSILDLNPEKHGQYDFIFTKGVLIHINPDELNKVYDTMYKLSKEYICVAEYYNPSPVSVEYRGEKNKLFKRDFAGEMLDKYSDLKLVDYGFKYRKDDNFPQDDITWFLLKKIS